MIDWGPPETGEVLPWAESEWPRKENMGVGYHKLDSQTESVSAVGFAPVPGTQRGRLLSPRQLLTDATSRRAVTPG